MEVTEHLQDIWMSVEKNDVNDNGVEISDRFVSLFFKNKNNCFPSIESFIPKYTECCPRVSKIELSTDITEQLN